MPVPKIAWTRGNETLPSDGRMSVLNGTLVIAELETSDSGNYTCTAKNTAGAASVSSNVTVAGKQVISVPVCGKILCNQNLSLFFCFPSVPTPPEIIRTGMKDIQVLEPKSIEAIIGSTVLTISGSNVSISCGVRGFPTPSVEWTKDGVLLGAEGSVLSLSSVDSNDTGLYTCTATSPLGSFDSQSTNLTVIGRCFIHFTERLLEDVKNIVASFVSPSLRSSFIDRCGITLASLMVTEHVRVC